jgi:hypothetical protein
MVLSFTTVAGLASAVVLGSESHGTHDHILLSQIRDSLKLEGQVPVFISPRNRTVQLYPQVLSSLLVASYDSEGYDGGIRTRLHTDHSTELTSKRVSVITTPLGPTENTALLLLLKSFPWERVLFAKALPINGSGIFAYLEVVA